MHNLETSHKNKLLSLCYINKSSLNKNFDDLQHVLSCTDKKFYMTAISKTRITKQVFLSNNLNYTFQFTPIKTSAGGTIPQTYPEGFRSWYSRLHTQTWCQKSFLLQYILCSIHSKKLLVNMQVLHELKKQMIVCQNLYQT